MIETLQAIFDWSEVWALLIPLIFIFRHKTQPSFLSPIVYYVYIALVLNIAANVIYNQKKINLDLPWHNNVLIYNIHSIARLFLFAWFFILLKQPFFAPLKGMIPWLFLAFVIINFTFFESLIGKTISARLHIIEASILLFYCLQYYLYLLKEEETSYKRSMSFWVVTGLSIFVITNFPVYLFYNPLTSNDVEFAIYIWKIHKIAHIIFCVFLAKAFYDSKQ
jgi:hypothetical protein